MTPYFQKPIRSAFLVILWVEISALAGAVDLAIDYFYGRVLARLAAFVVVCVGLALQELYRKWVLKV